ncbi:MAG: hypothetical protein ABSA77_08930 [Thermoguttaceae bacterium]|jgi:hypothetical protein
MGQPARVKSIDALQAVSAALECFHDDAASALDDLEMEIRRALQWIGQDCRQYWNEELRRSRDGVTEARLQLENARMFRRIAEEHSSFVEEKKALERAKRRQQIAETKVEAIPHWAVRIERAVNEYRGSRSQFANWLDADFPRAVAALSRMISDLETYVRLGVPVDEHSSIALAAARSADEAQSAEGAQKTDAQTNKTADQNIEEAH